VGGNIYRAKAWVMSAVHPLAFMALLTSFCISLSCSVLDDGYGDVSTPGPLKAETRKEWLFASSSIILSSHKYYRI
jgi:hypothetical protein